MMATLLEIKGFIKRFYERKDVYVKPVLKFILALVNFLLLNSKIGFMQQLRNPMIAVILSLICALLPLNAMVLIAGVVILANAYALSLEVCAVIAGLLFVMYLLYFRISAKYAIILVITPVCFMLGVPYAVPMLGGLVFGPATAVPAACGAVIYYLLNYMSNNTTILGNGEIEGSTTKVVSMVESLMNNKEMFICVLSMVLTVLVVYFIRRLSVDHSWEIAIGIGSVINIVVHLTGALMPEVHIQILSLILGTLASAVIAFGIKFFVFSVDYSRTERVQFEDDEYYYYVKAIPKNVIAEPKKTVKKIVTHKKHVKTVKRIDS